MCWRVSLVLFEECCVLHGPPSLRPYKCALNQIDCIRFLEQPLLDRENHTQYKEREKAVDDNERRTTNGRIASKTPRHKLLTQQKRPFESVAVKNSTFPKFILSTKKSYDACLPARRKGHLALIGRPHNGRPKSRTPLLQSPIDKFKRSLKCPLIVFSI